MANRWTYRRPTVYIINRLKRKRSSPAILPVIGSIVGYGSAVSTSYSTSIAEGELYSNTIGIASSNVILSDNFDNIKILDIETQYNYYVDIEGKFEYYIDITGNYIYYIDIEGKWNNG